MPAFVMPAPEMPAGDAQDDWKHRRRMLYGSVGASFLGLLLLALWGQQDGALHKTIADGLVSLILVLVPTYTVGAVVDDFLKRRGRNVDPGNSQ